MSWWERAYLFEIVRGHEHHRRRLHQQHVALDHAAQGRAHDLLPRGGPRRLRRQQPRQARADAAAGRRPAVHRLQPVRDGVPGARCIEIEAAFDPADDPVHPKYPARFEIDYSRCIFCGLCVEACPEDAIRMVKECRNLPTLDRDDMWLAGRAAPLESAARRRETVPRAQADDRRHGEKTARDSKTVLLYALRGRGAARRGDDARAATADARRAGADRDDALARRRSTRCSACTSSRCSRC